MKSFDIQLGVDTSDLPKTQMPLNQEQLNGVIRGYEFRNRKTDEIVERESRAFVDSKMAVVDQKLKENGNRDPQENRELQSLSEALRKEVAEGAGESAMKRTVLAMDIVVPRAAA